MLTQAKKNEYYNALLAKNSSYEGVFFVGVKTTGIFCRPTCPARKPKPTNCEFFSRAQEALLASYRPCKRCRPLSLPNEMSDVVQTLIDAVEDNPERQWRESDFSILAVGESTARRQFKRRFGMTFVAYARARRMGLAMQKIRNGGSVIDAQLSVGYESGSGFRDAFSRIMGDAPSRAGAIILLKAAWIDTTLGPMIAIADEDSLLLLEFVDRRGLEREVERLRIRLKAAIVPGRHRPIDLIEEELSAYFSNKLINFTTPLQMVGSAFQKRVWQQLCTIPAGETRSYSDIARAVGQPKAVRAVARANGSNQLAIIIPCHRVINADGALGGYGGGIVRKKWMLEHEGVHNERW